MFGTTPEARNLRVTIVSFGSVRAKNKRENDSTLLVDVAFEIAFTPEIAELLGERVLKHAFDYMPKSEEKWVPKPDVGVVGLVIQTGAQILTIRPHPEMPPVATIENVSLRHIKISKHPKTDQWMLSFVNTFLVIPDEVSQVIRLVKQSVYVTYEQQQSDLPFEEGDRQEDPIGAGQVVTPRKRGRPRKVKPEQEAELQAQHAAAQPEDQFADVPVSGDGDPLVSERLADADARE